MGKARPATSARDLIRPARDKARGVLIHYRKVAGNNLEDQMMIPLQNHELEILLVHLQRLNDQFQDVENSEISWTLMIFQHKEFKSKLLRTTLIKDTSQDLESLTALVFFEIKNIICARHLLEILGNGDLVLAIS